MSTKVSKSDQPHVPVLGDEIAKLGPNPLQATVDRLRAENAKLREDKERLDWVQENPLHIYWSIVANGPFAVATGPNQVRYAETIRAAIDAARADAARKEPPAKAHGCEVGE